MVSAPTKVGVSTEVGSVVSGTGSAQTLFTKVCGGVQVGVSGAGGGVELPAAASPAEAFCEGWGVAGCSDAGTVGTVASGKGKLGTGAPELFWEELMLARMALTCV